MKVAIITASTAVYKGEQEDASGKVIRKMVEEAGLDVVFMKALPTDKTVLSTVFQRMADGNLADLILTQAEQAADRKTVHRRQLWKL